MWIPSLNRSLSLTEVYGRAWGMFTLRKESGANSGLKARVMKKIIGTTLIGTTLIVLASYAYCETDVQRMQRLMAAEEKQWAGEFEQRRQKEIAERKAFEQRDLENTRLLR